MSVAYPWPNSAVINLWSAAHQRSAPICLVVREQRLKFKVP